MKRIVEVFTEDEFQKLKALKERMKFNWHDFIIECAEMIERDINKEITEYE